jgi:hypothetical protein
MPTARFVHPVTATVLNEEPSMAEVLASPATRGYSAAPAQAPFAPRVGQYVLFAACVLTLAVTAFALAAAPVLSHPPAAGAAQPAGPPGAHATLPAWTAPDTAEVLSYADGMRPDDALVQVRPGVFAKRSNAQGLRVAGRTVYYDIYPHQSFGPLRTGKVTERDVTVLARSVEGDALVLIYALK